ncbi:unnamed protein product, partial [Didymodactylos carnosus]
SPSRPTYTPSKAANRQQAYIRRQKNRNVDSNVLAIRPQDQQWHTKPVGAVLSASTTNIRPDVRVVRGLTRERVDSTLGPIINL